MKRFACMLGVAAFLVVTAATESGARGGGGHGGGHAGGGRAGGWHGGGHGSWGHHGSHGFGHHHFNGFFFFDPFFFPYYVPYAPYPYPPSDEPLADAEPGEEPEGEASPDEWRTASYGLLQLRGIPDGAAVDLDGRFWLEAAELDGRWLALPQGAHTLTVRVQGHEPVERRIDVVAGKTVVVRVGPFREPRA